MSNALFVTDFHHGPIIYPKSPRDSALFGNRAAELHRAFIRYANPITPLILDGGDQSTHLRKREKHLEAAARARKESMKFRGDYARAIGNHDPYFDAMEFQFNRMTHRLNQTGLLHTDVVVVQPEVTTTLMGKKYRYDYAYSAETLAAIVEECKNPNLIIVSHWAFNRRLRGLARKTQGKPYEYIDNSEAIGEILSGQSSEGKTVLTLHGHEHYFSRQEQDGYETLVMPSIVQEDVDFSHVPCGLFAKITDKNRGGIKVEYKKLAVGDKRKAVKTPRFGVIDNVPEEYMRRYARPSKEGGPP
ncbi:MAG: hypothetical protein AAGB32_01385 [Pseudomonadota bacterium]